MTHRRVPAWHPLRVEPPPPSPVSDALLAALAAGRWRPAAWSQFLLDASRASMRDVASHPAAALDVTALHLAVLAAARRSGRAWIFGSWLLTVTHLGLLGARRRPAVADVVTLVRGNLPALVAGTSPWWVAPIALGSDLVDGRLARRRGSVSAFGFYADTFADAAFWTWFALRNETDPRWRAAAFTVWAAPVAALGLQSIRRGGMPRVLHPRWVRPAAALQLVLTVRSLNTMIRSRRSPVASSDRPQRSAATQLTARGARRRVARSRRRR